MLRCKFILLFVFTIAAFGLQAQSLVFVNYPQQQLFYNPAFAGIDSLHHVALSGQVGYTYFYNPPVAVVASYNQPFGHYKNGLGASVFFQNDYYSRQFDVTLNYNHKFNLSKKMNLRIGASATAEFYHQYPYCPRWFFEDQISERNECNDQNPSFNASVFDFGAGMRYEWGRFFVGAAITNFSNAAIISHKMDLVSGHYFHLYSVTTGFNIKLSKSISTTPSFMFLHQGGAVQMMIANDVWIKKRVLLGAGFSANDNASFRFGFLIKKKLTMEFTQAINISPLNNGVDLYTPSQLDFQFSF